METSSDLLVGVLVWGGIGVAIAVIGYLYVRTNRADPDTLAAWAEAAQLNGLALKRPLAGFPRLEGAFDGRQVAVRACPDTTDQPAPTTYTAYHRQKSMPILRLERSSAWHLRRDREIGAAAFDERFHISRASADFAQGVFADPELQEALQPPRPNVFANHRFVQLSEPGIEREPVVIQERLRLADRVDGLALWPALRGE